MNPMEPGQSKKTWRWKGDWGTPKKVEGFPKVQVPDPAEIWGGGANVGDGRRLWSDL